MPKGRTQVIHGRQINAAVGALTANASMLLATLMDASLEQGHTIDKLKLYWELEGKTANEGPISLGIGSGLTAVQYGEAMNADPQNYLDEGKSEKGNRKAYILYVIGEECTAIQGSASQLRSDVRMLNEPVPSWKTIEGDSLDFFIHLHSSGSLTTGAILNLIWSMVIRWERD